MDPQSTLSARYLPRSWVQNAADLQYIAPKVTACVLTAHE